MNVFREIGNQNISNNRLHDFSPSDSEEEEGIPSHDQNFKPLVNDQDESEEEESKENANNLHLLKRDFYEKSKQLKTALNGMQQNFGSI